MTHNYGFIGTNQVQTINGLKYIKDIRKNDILINTDNTESVV